MTRVYALTRLLWRPGMLYVLLPLCWAIAIPVLMLAEAGTPVGALLDGSRAGAVRTARWSLTLLVPAAVGLAVTIARLEVQHAMFSWTLPDLRRRLAASTLLVALLIALGLGLLVGRGDTPWTGVATFSVALLSFAVVGAVLDVALPDALRWTAIAALAVAAFHPGTLADTVDGRPIPVLALSLASAAGLFGLQFSGRAARARRFRWSSVAPGSKTLYWAVRSGTVRDWRHSLATDRYGPWLRAAAYERSLGRGLSSPVWYLVIVGIPVALTHLMSAPAMFPIWAGMLYAHGRLQLASSLPYPLSRNRRARLAALGMEAEAVMFIVFAVPVLLLILVIDVPVIAWFAEPRPTVSWAAVLAMAWALAPVAQWAAARRPALDAESRGHAGWFVPFILYFIAASVSARLTTGLGPYPLAALTIVGGLALRAAHWSRLRHYYATADLPGRVLPRST